MGIILMVILHIIAVVYGLFTYLEMAFMPCVHDVHITSLSSPLSGESLAI